MLKISLTEIEKRIEEHQKWLKDHNTGERLVLVNYDLSGSNLRDSNLSDSNLHGSDLRGSDLHGSNLRGSNLSSSDLRGSDLSGSNLSYSDLRGSDLRDVHFNIATSFFALQCPEEGAFIGYKKCKHNIIVMLKILKNAKRSSATTRKCRCSKAKVLRITTAQGVDIQSAISSHDNNFIYTVGEVVSVDDFDTDRWNECSTGIHFYITRKEAEMH